LTLPSYLCSLNKILSNTYDPLIFMCGMLRVRVSISLCDRRRICFRSCGISSMATSQALPNPTTSGGASVPLLRPRSYPPPLIMGWILTLGLRRM